MKKVLISNAAAAVLVLLSYAFFVVKPLTAPMTDLAVYMEAGSRLERGLDIYEHVYNEDIRERMLRSGEKDVPEWYRMHYFYPPFLAALVRPWANLNHHDAKFYWTHVNFACLLLSLLCLTAILEKGPLSTVPAAGRFALLLFLACGFDPFLASFSEGQIDIPVLLLLSLSALAAAGEKRFLAGLSAGAAALFKISPGIVVLSFLFDRSWRAVVGSAAAMGLGLVWMLSLPQPAYSAFFAKFSVLASGGLETALALNMSLAKALLLPAALWRNPLAQAAVRAAILVLCLLSMRQVRLSSGGRLLLFSTAVVFMVLLSPTTWAHHFVWLFLPLVTAANSLSIRGQAAQWANLGALYCLLGRGFSIQSLAFLSNQNLLPAAHALMLASILGLQILILRVCPARRD